MSELAGYRVYWGTSASNLTSVVNVPSASSSSYKITGLGKGTYYFMVTAYDINGTESPQSAVASKVIL